MLEGEGKNDKRKEFVLSICFAIAAVCCEISGRPGGFIGVSDPSQDSVVCIPAFHLYSRWCWALLMVDQERLPAPSL